MPSPTKCFVLFSLALSVSALVTPHGLRNVNHHRAIAAVFDATVPEPVIHERREPQTIRRRSNNSARCNPKSSSSSAPSPAFTPAVNPEAAPPSSTSSSTTHTTLKASPKATPQASPKASPTSSAAKPASTSGGNLPSYLVGTQTGQGTYYGTGLGACGITNNDSQYIAAVSHLLFDTFPGYTSGNPNNNPICGKQVTAHYQGKSVTVTITDRCVGCAITDLDFSPSAFSQIADQSIGRISDMTWDWI